MEIGPLEIALLHADRQTDKMNVIGDFCDNANSTKKYNLYYN